MKRAYAHAGKRTKRSIAKIRLSDISWGEKEVDAFNRCKEAYRSLRKCARIAIIDTSNRLCFYVEVLDCHWGGIATQIPNDDIHAPHM